MNDLISRQAAIDVFVKLVPYVICDESTESYTNALADACNLIYQLPSAERRGLWLKGDKMADYPRIPYKAWETYCSCCGEIKEQINDNYCGNCGAKMDEVEE